MKVDIHILKYKFESIIMPDEFFDKERIKFKKDGTEYIDTIDYLGGRANYKYKGKYFKIESKNMIYEKGKPPIIVIDNLPWATTNLYVNELTNYLQLENVLRDYKGLKREEDDERIKK